MKKRKSYLEPFNRRREKILAMLASGATRAEVCARYKITRQRIAQIIQQAQAR